MLGQLVGKIENWGKFDTLYWSFITALTVGYGDIRPLKKRSKALAVIIALLGIMFTGVFVAITVESASRALNKHIDPNVIQSLEENSLQPFL
jgi:voltage-gated potassium channel